MSEPRVPGWVFGACVGAMLLLAGAFSEGLLGEARPKEDVPPLLPAWSDPATVRKVRKDMTFDGAPCSSCHDGSEPMQGDPKEKGVFHEAVKLQHGRNQHCFNCHHRVTPEDFANFDGAPIKLASVELLCARCHGTTYRDWKNGAHGRRAGHWDAKRGQRTEVCIACHEPHWPVFKPLEAAPPPRVNPRGPARKERHS